MSTPNTTAPAVDLPRRVRRDLPSIFVKVEKYGEAWYKAGLLDKYLAQLNLTDLFPNGMPKRRPGARHRGNTCKCWGCEFCTNILIRNAINRAKHQRWTPNEEAEPQASLSESVGFSASSPCKLP